MDFEALFQSFSTIKLAVVGDVMLDTYWWGHVERISPEAPVPIVALDKKELRIGGAGNVALNTVALGAPTALFSVIGKDEDGEKLCSLLEQNNIDTKYLVKSSDRITTNKMRIISRNQQMMRLDAEMTKDITSKEEELLLGQFKKYIDEEKPSIVIFEDYNKGVLTAGVIKEMIGLCISKNIFTAVDPKRKNFFAYKGVTIFKPNLKEVKEGLNLLIDEVSNQVLENIHDELHHILNHKNSLITLSEAGIFYKNEKEGFIIPTHIRTIADVSGAGDTVIAIASLVYASTQNIQQAASLANLAGGLVCEEVGTVAVDRRKLLEDCKRLL